MELVVKRLRVIKNGGFFRGYPLMYQNNDLNVRIHVYSAVYKNLDYVECFSILGVKKDSDQETVRQAFLHLVKQHHPDSGSEDADADKFQQIEKAYRKLQDKFHNERWTVNDCAGEFGLYYKEKKSSDVPVIQYDIKHTAPQHRQYLSYDGWGVGTPSQRHKQYQKLRASTAVENVYNHRINQIQTEQCGDHDQALIIKDKKKAKDIKTRYGMDRLVEDLIQESMARGDFDNLSGKGKPLSMKQDHHNPYMDLVTHKLNQVMIDNGFMPEWITLQKEIREDTQRLRDVLADFRATISPKPLPPEEEAKWFEMVNKLKDDVTIVNSKIGKYNLVVPLLPKQMLQFDLDREANKILAENKPRNMQTTTSRRDDKKTVEEKETVLTALVSMFTSS